MRELYCFILFFLVLFFTLQAKEKNISAAVILKQSAEKYNSLESYSDGGTVVSDVIFNGMSNKIKISYSIVLKKPNLYLIRWSQTTSLIPMPQKCAVWCDGTHSYMYVNTLQSYCKFPDPRLALASAAGNSNGITTTIPALFFEFYSRTDSFFSHLNNAKVIKTENIEGDDCFVISCNASFSKNVVLWISKSTMLIRKIKKSLARSSDSLKKKDNQIDSGLATLSNNVEKSNNTDKNNRNDVDLNGTTIELHNGIIFPEDLKLEDFSFKLPEKTTIGDSFFQTR